MSRSTKLSVPNGRVPCWRNDGDACRVDAVPLDKVVARLLADRNECGRMRGAPMVSPAVAPAIDEREVARKLLVDQVGERHDRRDPGAGNVPGDLVRQTVVELHGILRRRTAQPACSPHGARQRHDAAGREVQCCAEFSRKMAKLVASRIRRVKVNSEPWVVLVEPAQHAASVVSQPGRVPQRPNGVEPDAI